MALAAQFLLPLPQFGRKSINFPSYKYNNHQKLFLFRNYSTNTNGDCSSTSKKSYLELTDDELFKECEMDTYKSSGPGGPPGPNPVQLMPSISLPVLVLWGDEDPFTPLDGHVGKYFSSLPSQLSNVKLFLLEGVGHCPHDDRPDLVYEKLLPWLAQSLQC